jgi:hypothetical protein
MGEDVTEISMVERVARALDDALSAHPGIEAVLTNTDAAEVINAAARAAIEAMRAISLPMETAGLHVINSFGWQHNEKVPLMPAKAIFEAMIDAALSAPTGERGRR